MSVVWRKIRRDLGDNRTRTFLGVLSTAVGVLALGLVLSLSGTLRTRMTEDYTASVPSHVVFWGNEFTDEAIEAVLREPGVAAVEGQATVMVRWRPNEAAEWLNGSVVARSSFLSQPMDRVDLQSGAWPRERTLSVERQSASYYGLATGATVQVEVGRREQPLPLAGLVRSPTVFPPLFGGDATFYATPETVEWMTGFQGWNELHVRLQSFSQEGAEEAAERIKRRLDRMDAPVLGYQILDPGKHYLQSIVDALFLTLSVLGVLALGLSAFLTLNTLNAIVAQQVWQVGVMKVIGATAGGVSRIYLSIALCYGGLALLIAVPLAALGSYGMARWMLGLMNIEAGPLRLVPAALAVQVVAGLGVPVAAALWPAIEAARVTPRQAMSTYGLGVGFGRGRLDRWIGRVRGLPGTAALGLRNTFRRKLRLTLTLIALTLGGVIFIMVMSVRASLNYTLDVLLRDFGFDAYASFERPERSERLLNIASRTPGVTHAEVWDFTTVKLHLQNGEKRDANLWGLPPETTIFSPRLVAGRTLQPGDERVILLNRKIAEDEGIRLGDTITLTVNDRETQWLVVGLVLNLNNNQRDSFVPLGALSVEKGSVNRGAAVMVQSDRHDAAGQQALVRDLRAAYEADNLSPSLVESAGDTRTRNRAVFNIVIYLMLAMAVLAAAVGSVGLTGTLSINVVERSREIGVMRSIGATPGAILGIFVLEGVLVGALSWLLAVPLSFPGAYVFAQMISRVLVPMDFDFSVGGVFLWLAIVVALSALGSLWPALGATRISVRQALAYE